MTRLHLAALVLLSLAACRTAIPEGQYACTTAAECPTAWVCRAGDHRCWINELPVDGGVQPPDAFAVDAATHDAGPGCVTEICNGRDDDCDGLLDEGVLTIGDPVVATSLAGYYTARIVPAPHGFSVVGSSYDPVMETAWAGLDLTGAPTSALVTTPAPNVVDAISNGTTLVASVVTAAPAGELLTIDPIGGAPRSTFVLDGGSGFVGSAQLTSFDGSIVTAYVLFSDQFSTLSLARVRVNVAGTTPFLVEQTTLTGDFSNAGLYAVLHTQVADYVAFVTHTHELVLAVGPSDGGVGAFRVVGTIGSGASAVSLAVRDAQIAVGPSNPLAVAWVSGYDTVLADVTDPLTFAMDPARTFGDLGGEASLFESVGAIAMTALPAPSGSTPRHWLVTVAARDGLGVLEATAAGLRRVPVPNEAPTARPSASLAWSDGVLRVAESGNTGGIVTRAVGCE